MLRRVALVSTDVSVELSAPSSGCQESANQERYPDDVGAKFL
jgi:hypothetical protein